MPSSQTLNLSLQRLIFPTAKLCIDEIQSAIVTANAAFASVHTEKNRLKKVMMWMRIMIIIITEKRFTCK